MKTLYLDCETYNADRDISVGTYAYAETAQPLLITWALDDGPVQVIDYDPTGGRDYSEVEAAEAEFKAAIGNGVEFVAHNAMFDRAVLGKYFRKLRSPERWRCTMAKALAHGFPGSLDQLSTIFGLGDAAKLKDGKKLIQRFCKPAPANHKARRYTRETHPGEWARFVDYARQDIVAMRELDRRLPAWNEDVALWRFDQTVNDRGFAVDRELVEAGAKASDGEAARLGARFRELTGGLVERPSQRQQFKDYLRASQGIALPNTQADTLRGVLDRADKGEFLTDKARELLEIALTSNKTSTAKYKTLIPAISEDGRFRGGLQYAGAARTRRWAGRTYQPQNLPSRGLPDDVDLWIDAIKCGAHEFLFSNQMLYASAALRGVIVAPEGKRLAVADLSNIEGRVAAWLAGEKWKLEAFAAYDRGEGPDLYKVAAGRILGKEPSDITKEERNGIGKVAELALGYQGGVGAIQNFAEGKMAALLSVVEAAAPEALAQAESNYESWGRKRNKGATEKTEWLVSEAVKVAWRERHPKIVSLWHGCEDAARDAIRFPGTAFPLRPHLTFKAVGYRGNNYLLCRLPSGRFLVYFDPRISEDGEITYMGVNQITRQWGRIGAYGGKFVENACQSVARDVLASSMQPAREADYQIILTVHDELVAETVEGTGEDLAEIMATNPNWAEGLPLAAAGETMARYRK